MVESGAGRLFDAIAVLRPGLSPERFKEASSTLDSIVGTARQWQDSGMARKRKEEYLREHGEVTSELTFGGGSQ
jgi:hypothetical protein